MFLFLLMLVLCKHHTVDGSVHAGRLSNVRGGRLLRKFCEMWLHRAQKRAYHCGIRSIGVYMCALVRREPIGLPGYPLTG